MTQFNEANTIEEAIRDRLSGDPHNDGGFEVREPQPVYGAKKSSHAKWTFVHGNKLPREPQDVLVESWLKEALCRLNPDIAKDPGKG